MLDYINNFIHGFVAVPTISACREKGFFECLRQHRPMTAEQITRVLKANGGHLRVALRMMQSMDWLSQNRNGEYLLTAKAGLAHEIPSDIQALFNQPADICLKGNDPAHSIRPWIDRSLAQWNVSDPLLAAFLDGVLVIPLLLALHRHHIFDNGNVLFAGLNSELRTDLTALFINKGWASPDRNGQDTLHLSDSGRFVSERALLAGVTASYTPMLSQLPELLFGNSRAVFNTDESAHEQHLDRTLNVIASGFQHGKYFEDVDRIIVRIFNQPVDNQPDYVADMGCGDGTFLSRIYKTIHTRTARGKVLDRHPVCMIGADYNHKALEAAADKLSEIPHKLLLQGDIGDPERLTADLQKHGINAEEVLHIRSFLDHERPFIPPRDVGRIKEQSCIPCQGVYVDRDGRSIPPDIMVQSLVEHMERWSRIVNRHGLIILEAHCLPPDIIARNMSLIENLHFDACHAFSMQYLTEAEVFLTAAAEAGLFPMNGFSRRYPNSFPFSRITLHAFEKRDYKIRHPRISDLPALFILDKECRPSNLNTPQSEIQARLERCPQGQFVVESEGRIIAAAYSQRVACVEDIPVTPFAQTASLHTDTGKTVQLLGINVLPECQHAELGRQLLEFVLQHSILTGNTERVAGVTRCRNKADHPDMTIEEYVLMRNEDGQLSDPILRFHSSYGAVIREIIDDYRPEDADNQGCGVLIEYDIHNHLQSQPVKIFEEGSCDMENARLIEDVVSESVCRIMGPERADKFSFQTPLMMMGLDSLELMELRTLLCRRLRVDLKPTFFFRYETPEAVIRYLQNHAKKQTGTVVAPDPGSAKTDKNLPEHPSVQYLTKNTPEWERIVVDWNRTVADFPQKKCLHHLFEAQAELTPDAIAVEYGTQTLTYHELDSRANQLAHRLQSLGVGPDVVVGLCAERSLELPIGVAGILKAGGAYMPLDPAYPEKWLSYVLENAQTPLILTQRSLVDRFPARTVRILCLDSDWESIATEPAHSPGSDASSDNLLYVIYTSGSTGNPKGVAMPHQPLVNLVWWQIRQRTFDRGARTLQFTPISFDVSCQETFSTWASGGTLVVADETTRRDPSALLRFMQNRSVECLFLPFVALQRLCEAAIHAPVPSSLCEVITAGEQLQIQPALVQFFKRLPGCRLYNQYGPAESHVVTQYKLTGPPDKWPALPPIGRPVPNCLTYILDEQRRPVPAGKEGELYLGGVNIAREYLRRPELTSERFPDNLFAKGRFYKTGDIARYLPDGNIEFSGRSDHQVKIRGIRVELGEIEVILAQHPAVREAVVVARDDAPGGGKRLVAYVVPQSEGNMLIAARPGTLVIELMSHLAEKLPEYMVPARIMLLPVLPLTPSGKTDRRSLPEPSSQRPDLPTRYVPPRSSTERRLALVWQEALQLDSIGIHDKFFDLGGHSLLMARVQTELADIFSDKPVKITDLFQYPTIHALAGYLDQYSEQAGPVFYAPEPPYRNQDRTLQTAVAIIGMSCRFPGAGDLETFWQNLCAGRESVSFFSSEDLETDLPPRLQTSDYINARSILPDIDRFDARFFGYSEREAALLDPQHRLFMECAWEALETAGYATDTLTVPVGVYAGVGMNTYLINNVNTGDEAFAGRTFLESAADMQTLINSDKDFLPTHVSYRLNLKGPAIAVQAACSTALVAVHQACRSIGAGECVMALAGASSISVPQKTGYLFQPDMMFSPDGHCRAFDAHARGTVFGNGVGAVLLKRLENAVEDGDHIYAVVKGSSVNNDGAGKVGYTAPGLEAQAAVIASAQASAGTDARNISYVEAHGTGTALGDPIEIAALTQAFRRHTGDTGFCAIGSVKTNLGHLATAAGIAGLIKTVLALHHKQIPPSLHFKQPNPRIDFDNSPFFVNTDLRDWHETKRLAGVSAFGMGGTNAHLVLEEAPEKTTLSEGSGDDAPHNNQSFVFALSARDETALNELRQRYASRLDNRPHASLGDICHTSTAGRIHFEHRLAIVVRSVEQLRRNIADQSDNSADITGGRTVAGVAFLFTGQGSQYAGMGRILYETQPVFRQVLDSCADFLTPCLDQPIQDVISDPGRTSLLNETIYTQPVLFAFEYALARVWMSWGIRPDVLMGHSVGEYVAACLAGVFSFKDALKLVAARGRLIQALPVRGGMMSVQASPEQLREMIAPYAGQVGLAAINAPDSVVISGNQKILRSLENQLSQQDIRTKTLTVSHAFHSPLMAPMIDEFARVASDVDYARPRLPLIANLTGTLADEYIATPDYWAEHVRQPVLFEAGMATLGKQNIDTFLEIGPNPVLLALGQKCLTQPDMLWLPSLRKDCDDWQQMLQSLSRLYMHGIQVDWKEVYRGFECRRVPLPTYPFQRRSYWISPSNKKTDASAQPETPVTRLLNQEEAQQLADLAVENNDFSPEQVQAVKAAMDTLIQHHRPNRQLSVQDNIPASDISDWFYRISWQPAPWNQHGITSISGHYLIFADTGGGIGESLARELNRYMASYTLVFSGEAYRQTEAGAYIVNPSEKADFERLFQRMPHTDGIICLWGLDTKDMPVTQSLQTCCSGVLNIVQALVKKDLRPHLWLITQDSQAVSPDDPVSGVAQAMLWGLGRVIMTEHPEFSCTCLDIAPDSDTRDILAVLCAASCEPYQIENQIGLRNAMAYVARLEPLPVSSPENSAQRLLSLSKQGKNETSDTLTIRPDACYLITGGLGGLGRHFARWLGTQGARFLVLNGRKGPDTPHARQLIADLEDMDISVQVVQADISRKEDVSRLLETCANLAPTGGIIHAAGVLDDGMLMQQTEERFRRVLAPKTAGAWYLHELTLSHEIDFFVCFSSVASVLGNAGQGNYAAANAFLDALMHHRRTMGLPGVSISWGPWAMGGMAAELDSHYHRRLADLGYQPIQPQEGISVLAAALDCRTAHLTALPMDWNRYIEHYSMPLFMHLTESATSGARHENFRQKLVAAPRSGRHKLLISHVHKAVGRVLGYGADNSHTVGDRQGFFDLGMDSLGSIEMRNALQTSLECSLPATLAFDCPTVEAMANYLMADMFPAAVSEHVEDDETEPARTYTVVELVETEETSGSPDMTDVRELSEDEAEAMLVNELKNFKLET